MLPLLGAAFTAGCGAYQKEPGLLEAVGALPRPPSDLTVMTFNIRYGTARDGENSWPLRRELVFGVIAGHAPDIVGVQEALRFQLDEIREELPAYAETGVGRDDGRTAGEYSAILYRRDRFSALEGGTFWLSETPEVPGSMTWGNRIPRICTWVRLRERAGVGPGGGGRTFYVFNVHLDHQSEDSRRRSAEMLAARIAGRDHPSDAVIVTGDFNCGEQSAAIRLLTGAGVSQGVRAPEGWRGLIDAFRAVNPPVGGEGTFHAFTGATDGERIDHILVGAGSGHADTVEVIGAEIDRRGRGGRWPSDHFPVVAKIRFKP